MKKLLFFVMASFAFLWAGAQTIQITPMELEATVNQGETAVVYTVIANTGSDTLDITFPAWISRGTGGPDEFGYYWIDSDEEGGPNYEWVEISEIGNEIEGLGDDNVAGPFPIGFTFPFYGQARNHFWVSSNGAVSFNDQFLTFANQGIPTNSNYIDFIAWFWTDLMIETGMSHTYYKNYDNKVVIQFEKYVRYPGSTDFITAELILVNTGDIYVRYKQVTEGFNTTIGTIGIQSFDPSMGLQVTYNQAYVHSELALRFDSPSQTTGFITSVAPASFHLAPGTQEHVWITYDSEGYEVGTYDQHLLCVSNDTVHPEINIQNIMHVVNPLNAGFKGYVTDAATGYAINDVKVQVGEHYVYTNGNGWYELPLEPGVYDVSFIREGYQTLVVEDTTAFTGFSTLDVQLGGYYFLVGRVWAGDNYLETGFAYGYKMTEEGTVVDIYAEMVGEEGWYEFSGLSSAYYIVKAEPSPNSTYYGTYLPTYYGDVLHWEDATIIHLTQNTDGAVIHLIGSTAMPQGGGSISGIIENSGDQANAAFIPVILRIAESTEAVMVYSDASGNFTFSDLGYGTYELFAEIPGKSIEPMNITLDEATPSVSGIAMVIMDQQIIFMGIGEEEFLASLSQAYPNPATDRVSLLIRPKKPANLKVELTDISGRVIQTRRQQIGASGTVNMDLSNVPAGYYFIRISDENENQAVRSFIKE
jgi:hypothetical protein